MVRIALTLLVLHVVVAMSGLLAGARIVHPAEGPSPAVIAQTRASDPYLAIAHAELPPLAGAPTFAQLGAE